MFVIVPQGLPKRRPTATFSPEILNQLNNGSVAAAEMLPSGQMHFIARAIAAQGFVALSGPSHILAQPAIALDVAADDLLDTTPRPFKVRLRDSDIGGNWWAPCVIDLIVTKKSLPDDRSYVMLERVKMLSADRSSSLIDFCITCTLEVTPAQAAMISRSAAEGPICWVLRNPEDDSTKERASVNVRELYRGKALQEPK
jgi:hypothetical protein